MPPPFSPHRKRSWLLRLSKWTALAMSFAIAAAGGSFAALRLFSSKGIPDVAQLADHRPSIITRIRDGNGTVVGEFAQERRVVVDYRQIPDTLRDAIIAVEDADFFSHNGLNLRGIARAAVVNLRAGHVVEGGSSLTQQLAKMMFLTPERSFERKLEEAILALHIERTYSKQEILTFYCNQVYLGHNRYGVEAASRMFFGKSVSELDLAEAALLAGLPKKPVGYSPYEHPEAALERRNHVLDRMRDAGQITAAEAHRTKATAIVLHPLELDANTEASTFVEEVRRHLEKNYGERRLYHDGLEVYTSLDRDLQATAERAVRNGLRALDRRRGWRRDRRNLLDQDSAVDLGEWSHPDWNHAPRPGELIHGLVTSVRPGAISVRIGTFEARIEEAPRWTGRDVGELFRRGDVGLFRVISIDRDRSSLELAVEQEPQVEGAAIVMETHTARILAMVGGWDFRRSRFNRAVQARRQTGSAFKPIIYAAALDNGFTPADVLLDEPLAIEDPYTGEIYSPENYSDTYYGLTTVREAIEKSRNPVSVQILQRTGAGAAIDLAHRLGITAELHPYPSLALGVFEVSLLEMTAAYAAIADSGVYHSPYFIERIADREGRVLRRRTPTSRPAMSAEIAYMMTSLLRGVIQNGTGRRARRLGGVLAGKTGTTDDFTDAWFIGYSSEIAIGVWVGHDRKRSLGKGEVGAVAALPIWIEIMKEAMASHPGTSFPTPPGVEFVTIDRKTGLRASDICSDRLQEVFLRGTAPVSYCSVREHQLHALPYYLQKIYLEGGTLPPMASGQGIGAQAAPQLH